MQVQCFPWPGRPSHLSTLALSAELIPLGSMRSATAARKSLVWSLGSRTMTSTFIVLVLPATSVAEQITTVEPIGNVRGEGEQFWEMAVQSASSNVLGSTKTSAPEGLVAFTVIVVGPVKTGAWCRERRSRTYRCPPRARRHSRRSLRALISGRKVVTGLHPSPLVLVIVRDVLPSWSCTRERPPQPPQESVRHPPEGPHRGVRFAEVSWEAGANARSLSLREAGDGPSGCQRRRIG
jgi:hypothetical protein